MLVLVCLVGSSVTDLANGYGLETTDPRIQKISEKCGSLATPGFEPTINMY